MALTGAPGSDRLIRRAARIARRTKAELVGIHVEPADGLAAERDDTRLDVHRHLLGDLGGRYRELIDNDIGRALVRTAIAEGATQLVVGASRRSRWSELVRGSVINHIAAEAGDALDVHIIASPHADDAESAGEASPGPPLGRSRWARSDLPARRRWVAILALVAGSPALTAVLAPLKERLGFATAGFGHLLAVVAIAYVGGRAAGIAGAVAGFLLLNWFFADPLHTFTLANERDAIALAAFVTIGSVVSVLVERIARRSVDAARSRREAEALVTMAARLLREDDSLPDLLAVLVSTFHLAGAAVLQHAGGAWQEMVAAGATPPASPGDADLVVRIADDIHLAVGRHLSPDDHRVLSSFATQLAVALDSRRLRAEAAAAAEASRAGEVRDAILAAVSHDLRTPLTTIKTSVSTLLDPELPLDEASRTELLGAIDGESDRLNDLVGNLLDLGRLRSDALAVQRQPTHVADLVAAVVHDLPHDQPVTVDSARHTEDAKVTALDRGADDYVTKPFTVNELFARLRAVMRRRLPASESPIIETPDFSIDLAAKTVTTPHGPVRLTPTEWRVLEALVISEGRLVSQRQLLHQVWGPQYDTETDYLRTYLANLRRKLEPRPSTPRYLLTEPGMGYRFVSGT